MGPTCPFILANYVAVPFSEQKRDASELGGYHCGHREVQLLADPVMDRVGRQDAGTQMSEWRQAALGAKACGSQPFQD